MRIASIDIGTNTFRLLVSETDGNGSFRKLYVGREITRLGEGLTPEKMLISQDSMTRALKTLTGFSLKLKEYGVGKLRAVATSAVRESLNGRDFVRKVGEETGISVDVISGDEEARLTVRGVLNSVTFDTPGCLIFDIGGGSTEYVYVNDGEILNIESTGLGVVRLTEKYLAEGADTESEVEALDAHVGSVIMESLPSFPEGGDETLTLIGTAGTPTTLAAIELRLAVYNPVLVNNYVLTREKIERTLRTVLSLPRAERTKIPGLEQGREDLIVSGTAVVLKTMNRFMAHRLVVSDAGLLEGVAYSIAGGGGKAEQ